MSEKGYVNIPIDVSEHIIDYYEKKRKRILGELNEHKK